MIQYKLLLSSLSLRSDGYVLVVASRGERPERTRAIARSATSGAAGAREFHAHRADGAQCSRRRCVRIARCRARGECCALAAAAARAACRQKCARGDTRERESGREERVARVARECDARAASSRNARRVRARPSHRLGAWRERAHARRAAGERAAAAARVPRAQHGAGRAAAARTGEHTARGARVALTGRTEC